MVQTYTLAHNTVLSLQDVHIVDWDTISIHVCFFMSPKSTLFGNK